MKIQVSAPSRLHFGIIDLNGGLGRIYGSLGLALERPNLVIETSESDISQVTGEHQEIVKSTSEDFLRHFNIEKKYRINVKHFIPFHVGLGSGTQLKLAVARSLAELFRITISTYEIAAIMNRGTVSGIGTAAFECGGFIIDGGRSKNNGKRLVPPMIVRHFFPENWFLVVALPGLKNGLSGRVEDRAFEMLPQAPAEVVGRLCRLVIMKMLPALKEQDIVSFGAALTELQELTGECFSSVQGGVFAGDTVRETVKFMLQEGAQGAGQSSWGPAAYGVVEGKTDSEVLLKKTQSFLDSSFGGYAFCTKANNKGAEIKVDDKL